MGILNSIWSIIATLLGGLSVSGIIAAVIYGCLKGGFNKTISNINVKKISEDATNKGIDKIKEVSFKHSIQPIVESELQKINEKSNEHIQKTVSRLEHKLEKIILIQEKQAKYFDNSIGVSEQAKKELKEAIEDAKNDVVEVVESEVVFQDEQIKPMLKEEIKKETTNVER